MTEVIFCFDTEDFTSNHACDAIRDIAQLLESEDIRGCFMIVGLVAKQLSVWHRDDVIASLKHHEIDFHTYGHSLHPNICEYTDVFDYHSAMKQVFDSEGAGLDIVKKVFNRNKIFAAVPPGPSVSYAALYTYPKLGIPVYADSPLHMLDGEDIYFCNTLHIEYFKSLEELFFPKIKYDINNFINHIASRKRVILYNHPNMVLYRQFWDSLNYNGINKHPFGSWEEPERRPETEVKHFYNSFRSFIHQLKNDGRFVFRTIAEVIEKQSAESRIVTKAMIHKIRASLFSNFGYITNPMNLSLSDIFNAVTAFLKGDEYYIPVESYGFLEIPQGIEKPCYVSGDDLLKAANNLQITNFLPTKIPIGNITAGPADYLYAALDFLCGETDIIKIEPKPQQCSLDEFTYLNNFALKDKWLFSKDFKDEYLSDRLKLQAWTIHR